MLKYAIIIILAAWFITRFTLAAVDVAIEKVENSTTTTTVAAD